MGFSDSVSTGAVENIEYVHYIEVSVIDGKMGWMAAVKRPTASIVYDEMYSFTNLPTDHMSLALSNLEYPADDAGLPYYLGDRIYTSQQYIDVALLDGVIAARDAARTMYDPTAIKSLLASRTDFSLFPPYAPRPDPIDLDARIPDDSKLHPGISRPPCDANMRITEGQVVECLVKTFGNYVDHLRSGLVVSRISWLHDCLPGGAELFPTPRHLIPFMGLWWTLDEIRNVRPQEPIGYQGAMRSPEARGFSSSHLPLLIQLDAEDGEPEWWRPEDLRYHIESEEYPVALPPPRCPRMSVLPWYRIEPATFEDTVDTIDALTRSELDLLRTVQQAGVIKASRYSRI